MVTLQQKFDALARMNGSAAVADSLAERDALHMRSLQQRLEQLVAVHRQLLRKFASLELETVELKKKTQLRDERIRQLEGNSRGLISNIRQQAERHVGELTHLREQMQVCVCCLWWICNIFFNYFAAQFFTPMNCLRYVARLAACIEFACFVHFFPPFITLYCPLLSRS